MKTMNKTETNIMQSLDNISKEVIKIRRVFKQDHAVQQDILKLVAQYFDVSVEEIKSKSRLRDKVITPKHFYYLFNKGLLGTSLQRIAFSIGWGDHASVLHGCNKIAGQLSMKDHETTKYYRELITLFEAKGYDVREVEDYVQYLQKVI